VVKGHADHVLISGHDGGTGAAKWTSIKSAGLPWELGLAETQRTLIENHLRAQIRIQVDGQLRTGRDLAVAALLGAEEFGFGTVLLVGLGCAMLRKCHLNACPMGVATQDPELRAHFAGKPEHVERFLRFLARDLRERMAALGFRTVDEMIGRSDRLEPDAEELARHPKTRALDLSALLGPAPEGAPRSSCGARAPDAEEGLDGELLRLARPALEERRAVRIELPVRNIHRSVGARLSGEVTRRFAAAPLPEGTLEIILRGSAGQSLGAFLAPGIALRVEGDANDYVGKGMSGGRIVLVPPAGATFPPHENVIVGNTVLYGATGGELYVHGIAGERFAVRNSGARAVVEGVGDHGGEYMTGGVLVVLGHTGNNFAAGMSGGVAYVYDETELFDTKCNLDTVDLESVWTVPDQAELRALLEQHLRHTGSRRARMILEDWETHLPLFVKVMPLDYRRSLERMRLEERQVDRESVAATEEVFGV